MSPRPSLRITACVLTGALSLLLGKAALGEEAEPGQASAASPARESSVAVPPASEASAQEAEMSAPPEWAQTPSWMSYDEMQMMMRGQGVELPPMPSPDQEIQPPPMPPFMAGPDPEEQKRLFDIFESMTQEQQEACFAVARWQSFHVVPPQMPAHMPPGYGYQQGGSLPPAYQMPPGQSFPSAMPRH